MIIIIEGIDNTGKDTQIKLLQSWFAKNQNYSHVLHYSNLKGLSKKQSMIASYDMYSDMFLMLTTQQSFDRHFILNRSHIGEAVYSPMYRDYNGDYVFDIEMHYKVHNKKFFETVFLFTFIDKPMNAINRDDGLSFTVNPDKKQNEIDAFVRAHNKSHINNKLLIDISDKSIEIVHQNIINFIENTLSELKR